MSGLREEDAGGWLCDGGLREAREQAYKTQINILEDNLQKICKYSDNN